MNVAIVPESLLEENSANECAYVSGRTPFDKSRGLTRVVRFTAFRLEKTLLLRGVK